MPFYYCLFFLAVNCKSQNYPLRTYTALPPNAHLKDTFNELKAYEGVWKGTWENKSLFITLKKANDFYKEGLGWYADILVAKFKVINNLNGSILYDNTNLPDRPAKILGGKVRKLDDKYSLNYLDNDLCGYNGYVTIDFANQSKTLLNFNFSAGEWLLAPSCPFYNSDFVSPLPNSILLTRQ